MRRRGFMRVLRDSGMYGSGRGCNTTSHGAGACFIRLCDRLSCRLIRAGDRLRRTLACQYGSREELAIRLVRQSIPMDTSSPVDVLSPL